MFNGRLGLGGIKDKTATVRVSLSEGAKAAAQIWGGRITPSRAAALLRKNSAKGNIFDERHEPQVAKAGGTIRYWAEPETAGEAYIPLPRRTRYQTLEAAL